MNNHRLAVQADHNFFVKKFVAHTYLSNLNSNLFGGVHFIRRKV